MSSTSCPGEQARRRAPEQLADGGGIGEHEQHDLDRPASSRLVDERDPLGELAARRGSSTAPGTPPETRLRAIGRPIRPSPTTETDRRLDTG